MLTIRLQRVGRRNDPAFRVVVTESTRGPKSGRNVELVGSHNPRQHTTHLKGERIKHWISQGAQVSDTMHNLLIREGIIEGKKINVLPKKSPVVKEKEEDSSEGTSADKTVSTDSGESKEGEALDSSGEKQEPAPEQKEEEKATSEPTPKDEAPEDKKEAE